MRVLVIGSDKNVFVEGSDVARRLALQAQAVERLDVIVPHGPAALVPLSGNAVARGFGLGKRAGTLRTLLAGLRIARPDVVSSQDPFLLGFLAWVIARMRGAKLHLQVHTDAFSPEFARHSLGNHLKAALGWFLLARADLIRVVSERIRRSIEESLPSAHVAVLPVHIDAGRAQRAVPLNRAQKYPAFKKLVLWVGRLEAEKDPEAALEVFAELGDPAAGLVVLGSGSGLAYLKGRAKELGIESRVVFEPYQDPYPFYKAADLMLQTSRYEGYGAALVEALLCECPVVSLDVGVAGEAGAMVAPRERLADAAREVLRSGARGRLAFALPSEPEYRDLWHAQMVAHAGTVETPRAEPIPDVRVGFVGQGWIGKNYADELERRGIPVVRYALEPEYAGNKERVKECDVVFIAVPTPTTPEGFDDAHVRSALEAVGEGKVAVIKSTVLPGTTKKMQALFSTKFIFHSPEFLTEATATYDAAHPTRNIVGLAADTPEARVRAEQVIRLLPPAAFELICTSTESELIKYANNAMLALKVVHANVLYDLAQHLGADYALVRDSIGADPRIGRSHLDPLHKSGHQGATPGRGAGGDCFIKDFEAFRRLYGSIGDEKGAALLDAVVRKNVALLQESGKDIELLKKVYGEGLDI